MIFAYVKKYFDGENRDRNHFQLVLQRAMDYVNETSGLQLSFNYSFTAHKIIDSYSQWIDDDDVSVLQNNNTIICISDDESDDLDEPNELVDIRRNGCTKIHFVSHKMQLTDYSNRLFIQSASLMIFSSCFLNTNFRPTSNVKGSAKCPLCCKIVDRKDLNFHFNDCDLFSK